MCSIEQSFNWDRVANGAREIEHPFQIEQRIFCVPVLRSIIAEGGTKIVQMFKRALHWGRKENAVQTRTHTNTDTQRANTRPQYLILTECECECVNEKQTVTFALWSRFGFYFYIYTHKILYTFCSLVVAIATHKANSHIWNLGTIAFSLYIFGIEKENSARAKEKKNYRLFSSTFDVC